LRRYDRTVANHPGDIRSHPVEDCPVCQELGSWADCEDSLEWIEAHEALREIRGADEVERA
jgi:hypothetical protein